MKSELIVFVRIGLYMLAGRLSSGGWLPQEVADMITSPDAVEAATGVIIGGLTFAWYLASEARKKLKGGKS